MKTKTMGKTIADGLNRGLKPRPITPGLEPQNQMTVRTTITTKKKQSAAQLVKIGGHIAVPPNPPTAPGTVGRPGPREKPAMPLLENLLDAGVYFE
jgi:hypothetical protein